MILEINGRRVEVSDDFGQLSPEEQQRTVEQIASEMGSGQRAGVMQRINRGIARGLGTPVDLVAGGLRMAGVETGDAPLGGSESLMRGMEMLGPQAVTRQPAETRGERMLEGVGEAAGALVPALGLARAVQGGGQLARDVGQSVTRPFVSRPVAATATELAAGAGAAVGQDIASGSERFGPVLEPVGALVGGLVAGMGPGAALRGAGAATQYMPVIGSGLRAARTMVAPFTDAGARDIASNRLRGLVADPEGTAAAVREPQMTDLTPAQAANDPNLLALERAAMDRDPALRDNLLARRDTSERELMDAFREPAAGETIETTRDYIEQRRADFRSGLEARVSRAEARAAERVERLSPQRRESENATIVRQELDRAYDAAQVQERELWGRVPRGAEVPTERARAAYLGFVDETGRARANDIPREATELLGPEGFAESETVLEMHALYSQLRQRAREAMAGPAPNENRARIANGIAEAILEDLGAVPGTDNPVGRAINEARAYTRAMNEVFGQGTVGQVTQSQRSGGDAVAPEATLSRAMPGGVRSAVAVDDFRRAGGPRVLPPIEDYLRGRLVDRGRGRYDPASAEAFGRANREVLERFPGLSQDMEAAAVATREAQALSERVGRITRALDDPRQNVSAAFLAANPGGEIAAAVFQSRDPTQAAAILRRAAQRSDRAMAGLKSGFLEHLIQGSLRGGADRTGTRRVAGNDLFGALQDPRTRSALARIFTSSELARMDRISRAFQGLQGSREGRSLDEVVNTAPNQAISYILGTLAARTGAQMGAGTSGASLRTASMATNRMNRLMDRLTNSRAEALLMQAVQDRDLFAALMSPVSSDTLPRIERSLAPFLIGAGTVAVSEE